MAGQCPTPAAEAWIPATVLSSLEAIRDGRFRGVDSRWSSYVTDGWWPKAISTAIGPRDAARPALDRQELHVRARRHRHRAGTVRGSTIRFRSSFRSSRVTPTWTRASARSPCGTCSNMSSGLDCNDWNTASRGNEERMYDTRDWVGFILDLPMANEPGTVASYCTGGVVVLGQVISLRARAWRSTPTPPPIYLGRSASAVDLAAGRPMAAPRAAAACKLRPRDAAKLGQLYLNGGVWNGARVVPADWVTSRASESPRWADDGYGSLWWKRSFAHGMAARWSASSRPATAAISSSSSRRSTWSWCSPAPTTTRRWATSRSDCVPATTFCRGSSSDLRPHPQQVVIVPGQRHGLVGLAVFAADLLDGLVEPEQQLRDAARRPPCSASRRTS